MDEEKIQTLMLDALDRDLTAEESAMLGDYLRQHPDTAHEWQAMLAVDTLFRLTPLIAPPPYLAARIVRHLPNTAYRRWFTGSLFVGLLLVGIAPVLILVWALNQSGGLAAGLEPVATSLTQLAQLFRALLGAFVAMLEDVVVQQPVVLGWLALMLGVILTWGTVYRQISQSAQPVVWQSD